MTIPSKEGRKAGKKTKEKGIEGYGGDRKSDRWPVIRRNAKQAFFKLVTAYWLQITVSLRLGDLCVEFCICVYLRPPLCFFGALCQPSPRLPPPSLLPILCQ
jgi:hypothetical protein